MSRPSPTRLAATVVLAAAVGWPPSVSPAAAAGGEPSEALRWLQGYVRLDTRNPPGNEVRGAAYLARILHREGIPTRLIFTAEGQGEPVRPARRSSATRARLLLLHHLDVVEPGPGWSGDPFGGELHDGSLWGRGAVDVKSLGVAQLAAFVDSQAPRRPPRPATSSCSPSPTRRAAAARAPAGCSTTTRSCSAALGAVLNEGGANRAVNGQLLWWGVETAQKRPLWLRVTADGRGGHASGLNPHSAAHG